MHPTAPDRPAERRRLQHREEARRAILDGAEALLLEDGYEGFSMRRLAGRCGYTAPTIYHYFGDKQRLIDAVLEERFAQILAWVRGVGRRSDPAETVRARLDSFVRFSLENPIHYRLLTMARPAGAAPPDSAEAARVELESPLAELLAAGRLRARSVDEAVQCLWAVVNGVLSLRIQAPAEAWVENLEEFALDTVLRGLVSPVDAPGGGGTA